jgi:hypothetical protein
VYARGHVPDPIQRRHARVRDDRVRFGQPLPSTPAWPKPGAR